jgi:hypothetical protein
MLTITLICRARKDCWKVCSRDTRVIKFEIKDDALVYAWSLLGGVMIQSVDEKDWIFYVTHYVQ